MSGWMWALVGAVVGALAVLVGLWVYLARKWPRG